MDHFRGAAIKGRRFKSCPRNQENLGPVGRWPMRPSRVQAPFPSTLSRSCPEPPLRFATLASSRFTPSRRSSSSMMLYRSKSVEAGRAREEVPHSSSARIVLCCLAQKSPSSVRSARALRGAIRSQRPRARQAANCRDLSRVPRPSPRTTAARLLCLPTVKPGVPRRAGRVPSHAEEHARCRTRPSHAPAASSTSTVSSTSVRSRSTRSCSPTVPTSPLFARAPVACRAPLSLSWFRRFHRHLAYSPGPTSWS